MSRSQQRYGYIEAKLEFSMPHALPPRPQSRLTRGENFALIGAWVLIVGLAVWAAVVSAFGPSSTNSAQPQPKPTVPASQPAELPEDVRRGIDYYNPEPDKKVNALKTLYSHALHQAAHYKDTKTCAADLEKYAKQLAGLPKNSRAKLTTDHLPARTEALHPVRNAWVCRTAKGMSHADTVDDVTLGDLESYIDNATRYANAGDTEACYEILRQDYRTVINQVNPATRIAASHTMLALPGELADSHLAGICSHKPESV